MNARGLAVFVVLVGGCSSSTPTPLVEYPAEDAGPVVDDAAAAEASAPDAAQDSPDDAVQVEAGEDGSTTREPIQLSDGPCFIEGVTSDGHLVYADDADLVVWPYDGNAPVVAAKNYDVGYDMLRVRGHILGMWTGMDILNQTMSVWSKTGGVEEIATPSSATWLFSRPSSDDYAYMLPSTSALWGDLYGTTAGQGKGVRLVSKLETGVVTPACQVWVAYTDDDLLVGGCPNAGTAPRVAGYALDGSGQTRMILDGSSPGMWLNHTRSQVLVQTSTASSLRSLVDASAPLALDGRVMEARFSADDSVVVYRTPSGQLKRASTHAPTAPSSLGTIIDILDMSADARFAVVATTGTPADNRSDLLLVDTTATASAPMTLASEKAWLMGISRTGGHVVYRATPQYPVFGADELYVADTAGGTPQRLTDLAQVVEFDGDVVYWFEYDEVAKKSVLKAVRLSALSEVIEIAAGLDPLTSHAQVVGTHLYVASKLGLWDYPALSP